MSTMMFVDLAFADIQFGKKDRPGIFQTIKDDHRVIEAFYDQTVSNIGNTDAYTRWSNQFTWQVARHLVSEELCFYPELSKHLGEEGEQIVESDRAEHQEIKEQLKAMESMDPMSDPHITSLKETMSKLKTHISTFEDEHGILPTLEAASLSEAESASIAKSFERTKHFVPTRGHPSSHAGPESSGPGTFKSLAAFLAMPGDKIRDMVAKFPSRNERDAVADAAKSINVESSSP